MDTIFLVVSLFLPRTIIIIYYFLHLLPPNTVPTIGDVLLTVFIPRALILIYIAQNLGIDSPWFWIHLIVGVFVYFGGGRKVKKKWKNR
ncbi:MAG: hypothetical protein ABI462_10470 [Ignavibacteria bacterium]